MDTAAANLAELRVVLRHLSDALQRGEPVEVGGIGLMVDTVGRACYTPSQRYAGRQGMESVIRLDEQALKVVKSGLALKRNALEHNLRQYSQRAARFEQEYGMTSDVFAERFRAGALGDDADWFEWEFTLDAARETQREMELLDSITL
jgi:hypothetical protein